MSKRYRKLRALLIGLLSLAILLSACSPASSITPEQPDTPQVLVITQVLTQVITPTPVTPTPTIPPTAAPTATATFDPYSVPIYFPLEGCVASRLHAGDVAMVTPGGGPNGIRYGLDIHFDTIVAYAQPGSLVEIVGGPWCSRGWIVWLVKTADGTVGYTPEGDGNEYWLIPAKKP